MRFALLDQVKELRRADASAGERMTPFLIRRVFQKGGGVGIDAVSHGIAGDQPPRIFHRQRPQQQRVDRTENRRVSADPKSKSQDCNCSHRRRLCQHPQREPQISDQAILPS